MSMLKNVLMIAGLLMLFTATGESQTESQKTTKKVFDEVGIDQKLNERIPLDLVFRDEKGNNVRLGDYFHSKPVVLSLVYYECPMLCTQVLNGMVESFLSLKFTAGSEYEVVTVSFDPRDTPDLAEKKKAQYLKVYGRKDAAAGWHFLTGEEESIKKLTDAVGFHYVYDNETKQFAHASGIMVLTPEGRLARYFYGIDYPEKDLRFALMEAAQEKIGSPVDQILLLCYHYDPATGKYGLVITNIFRVAGVITIVVLGGFLFIMFRRERHKSLETAKL